MSEADIRAERIKKLDILKDAGMEAYPARSERDTTIADWLSSFESRETSGKASTIAGRVVSRRGQGGIIFADVHDGSTSLDSARDTSLTTGGTGKMQVVAQADACANIELFEQVVDIGDFVQFTGIAFTTKRGTKSMQVSSWKMLAKSLLPIPDQWYGLKDEEAILRQRYLDVLLNEDVRAMFERRAKFWEVIRDFYLKQGFLEVESPVLENSPGGADARPFITHHNALDIDVYLRISLELWHKRLLVAGFPKVFEIGRVFRNEGQSREHLQDFTFLESYEAYSDMHKGMRFIEELYRHIAKEVYSKYTFEIGEHTVDLADKWEELIFSDLIMKEFGIDPLQCSEKEAVQAVRDAKIEHGEALNKARAIDHLWKKIRKAISGPAFLVGVPTYLEPLAKRSQANPETVERMQIIIAGTEMGKGFSELNDPLDQRARFEVQQKLRDAGDDEAQRLDEDYIRAMEYGMPPAFGFGVSERLFAFLENKPAYLAQLFPLLRPRHD